MRAALTGCASGIGAAVRRRLEADGARVVGVDLRDAEVEADLSDAAERRRAAAALEEACEGRLDRLVLCAGLGPTAADRAAIPSVNFFGAVELLDALRPSLEAGSAPAVVVVCSNSAQVAPLDEHPYVRALLEGDEPRARHLAAAGDGFLAYAGSKHALCRAVRRRATAFGRAGVRLNGLAPGPVDTPLLQATLDDPVFGPGARALDIPLGRRGSAEEMAGLVAFLLGPEAAWVHGSILYADGGWDAALRPDRF